MKKWEQDMRIARRRVAYTDRERRLLAPVRHMAQVQAHANPDRRDIFLCHAWEDREGAAKELHDWLEAQGVDVWFSEKDIQLGVPLTRAIDRGLRVSRIGVVLVTPAMFRSLEAEGIADKELSALLATDRVIPVMHETSFDELNEMSPLLASRAGLNTKGSSFEEIAIKIAENIRSRLVSP